MKSTNYENYEKLTGTLVQKMTNSSQLIDFGSIKWGRSNKWEGVSGFGHQIDVSLESSQEVLLVECKHIQSKRNVSPDAFLTMRGRVMDIAQGTRAMTLSR